MKHQIFAFILALPLSGGVADAATLGLTTSAPMINGTGDVEYFEIGSDGDLSMFLAPVSASSGLSLDTATAEVEFGFGFDLLDSADAPGGGFSVTDINGDFISGDLLELGFRAQGVSDGIVELHFNNLSGAGAPEWTDTLLMEVTFAGAGSDPFSFFSDGSEYGVTFKLSGVGSANPGPNPIPLPGSILLLLGGIVGLASLRRRS